MFIYSQKRTFSLQILGGEKRRVDYLGSLKKSSIPNAQLLNTYK